VLDDAQLEEVPRKHWGEIPIENGTEEVNTLLSDLEKLLKERGLPVREGGPVAPDLGTRLPARGEATGGRVITAPAPGEPSATPEAAPAPASGEKPHEAAPAAKPHGPGGH